MKSVVVRNPGIFNILSRFINMGETSSTDVNSTEEKVFVSANSHHGGDRLELDGGSYRLFTAVVVTCVAGHFIYSPISSFLPP